MEWPRGNLIVDPNGCQEFMKYATPWKQCRRRVMPGYKWCSTHCPAEERKRKTANETTEQANIRLELKFELHKLAARHPEAPVSYGPKESKRHLTVGSKRLLLHALIQQSTTRPHEEKATQEKQEAPVRVLEFDRDPVTGKVKIQRVTI